MGLALLICGYPPVSYGKKAPGVWYPQSRFYFLLQCSYGVPPPSPTHIKLCFGCDSLSDSRTWHKKGLRKSAQTSTGQKPEMIHVTPG